ncbi:MAG TPA: S8 family serine peptidase [Gemmatimonadales bacterium]
MTPTRSVVAVLLLGLVSVPSVAAQQIRPQTVKTMLERKLPPEAVFVPGQVIVKMKTGAPPPADRLLALRLESAARQTSGGEFVYRFNRAYLASMAPADARDRTLAVVDSFRASPDVEYAQPNFRVYPVDLGRAVAAPDRTPNDARFADQWHYRNNGTGAGASPGGINLPRAWDTDTGSSTVVVSILDTGILPTHPDITGSANLAPGYDMIDDSFVGNDGDGRDANATDPGDASAANECFPGSPAQPSSWHGTHVAGTVGVGRTNNGTGVAGINWAVTVQPVRVLGKCGGSTVDINDAIRWAAGLSIPGVPANPSRARVISMSLGTPPGTPCSSSPSTQAAINDAVAAGAVVVVAAGNDATDASQVLPASCNNVITVAASDARGRLVTRYSNFGSTVEIMAPGGDVDRDDNGDGQPDGVLSMVQGGYAYYNGTSMATPHVAGVAALWLAATPNLTPAQLLAELQARALPRSSAECPQPCGAGLLNALRDTTPAATSVTLVLDPDKTLANGETTTARATVRVGGVPRSGVQVTFATGDPGIARVAPATVVTNVSGVATATVTGVKTGNTSVSATANGVTVSTPVKVPDLSVPGLLVLILLIAFAAARRARQRPAAA